MFWTFCRPNLIFKKAKQKEKKKQFCYFFLLLQFEFQFQLRTYFFSYVITVCIPICEKAKIQTPRFSICSVFSALHDQILTDLSRGRRQAQDICYSVSRRHGRDSDTGCQDNLTRQASCFIGAFKKCATVTLAPTFRTSCCLLLDGWALHIGGIEMESPAKTMMKVGRKGKRGRKRSRTRDLFGCAMCLKLAGDAIESDTPGWSCQTATSCRLYSHIAGV